MRTLLFTLLTAATLLGLSADALAAKKIDAEAPLVRPDDAPDDDATGRIKLRLDPKKGWQRFEVKVEDVDGSLVHEVWIQDAIDAETFTKLAELAGSGDDDHGDDGDDDHGDDDDDGGADDLVLDHDDDDDDDDDGGDGAELKLKLDTKKGDELPLGAEQLADLEGLRVEIRQDGAVVLFGEVPALGSGGGDGGGQGGSKDDALTQLVRPDDGPDADATGHVRLRRDTKKGRQEFEVEAEHVDTDVEHEVFLQDALDADTFSSLGVMEQDDDDELELEFDTEDGDALPFGVSDLGELAGLRLEVRRGDDVVLYGDVPAFGASKKPSKAKEGYGPGPAAGPKTKARLDLRSKPSKGDERITLMVKALSFADGASYALFVESGVEDDGFGGEVIVYDDVGGLDQLGSSKNARYRRKTKKGQELPLGVGSVTELGGLRFEVRDDEGGVHVEGVIPALD